LPAVHVIEQTKNRGFAGGCNAALRDLGDLDFVALVNNDVTVSRDWLAPLVDEMGHDERVGAVMPKVLLADQFRRVQIASPTRRASLLDRRPLGVRIHRARANGRELTRQLRFVSGWWGAEWASSDAAPYQWSGNGRAAELWIPAVDDVVALQLSALGGITAQLTSSAGSKIVHVDVEPCWYDLPPDGATVDVIHTTGIAVDELGYASDRGYLHEDDGTFDTPASIDVWSGAAVLLRRRYLDDVGTFDEPLFMYYEDVDLSLRGRSRGWHYRVRPDAVVRHVHQAAASAAALTALYYTERNHLLIARRHRTRREFMSLAGRHFGSTMSYLRRDVAAPLAAGRAPRSEPSRTRVRSLADALLGS
jgi:GT2 family glycosyltransferase